MRGRRAIEIGDAYEVGVLQAAALVWALAASASVLLEAFDANGVAPATVTAQPVAITSQQPSPLNKLFFLISASDLPRAWLVVLAATIIVIVGSRVLTRWTGLLIPLWAALIAVLAPVVVDHILVGPDHDFGGAAGAIPTLAANVGFGCVLMAALRVASGRTLPAETLTRRFLIVGVGLGLVALTDPLLLIFKLQGAGAATSLTAWFGYARASLLLVLLAVWIVASVRLRNRRLGPTGLSVTLAASSLIVAGWFGIGVATTRIPPQFFVETSITQNFLGFDVPDAPTVAALFSQWRPNVLLFALAVVAVTVYLGAVIALRRGPVR